MPRRLTRSFSSKPPSLAPAELTFTPGTRCRESAMFLSGSLPTSSAVITSTCESALRFWFRDCCSEARMPVTVTACNLVASEAAVGTDAANAAGCSRCLLLCRRRQGRTRHNQDNRRREWGGFQLHKSPGVWRSRLYGGAGLNFWSTDRCCIRPTFRKNLSMQVTYHYITNEAHYATNIEGWQPGFLPVLQHSHPA